MAKQINRTLMRRSILWVLHRYSSYSIEKMRERRIRGWREGDDEKIMAELTELRRAWSDALAEYQFLKRNGDSPEPLHFDIFKARFLSAKAQRLKWTIETRNLYSSVISTYIGFEQKGIKKKRADELVALEKSFNTFFYPNTVVL